MSKRKNPFANAKVKSSKPVVSTESTLESEVRVETVVRGNSGRPSPYSKDEKTKRLTIMLPETTIDQLKRFLLNSDFNTQGGAVNAALLEFLQKHSDASRE